MKVFILIMTLVSDSTSRGQTISSVSGFKSMESCTKAADLWQQSVIRTGNFRVPIAICAEA